MTEHGTGDVTGLVLAGGHSTRFGAGHKALASFGDGTVIESVLNTVDRRSDRPPVIAVRNGSQRDALAAGTRVSDVRFVEDDPRFDGPLAGLVAGIHACDTQWLLVCACDMPLVEPEAIAHLEALRAPGVEAVAPTEAGAVHPLLTLYRTDAVAAVLEDLPAAAGARAVLDGLASVRRVPVEQSPVADLLRRSLVSIDTKADLAAAQSPLRHGVE